MAPLFLATFAYNAILWQIKDVEYFELNAPLFDGFERRNAGFNEVIW